jgi:para-aminobenzoate synthetase/4-amino-4-deoxychorismate lyase
LRVVRIPLPLTLEPERAAILVRQDQRPFALIGRWAGGGALIGSEPIRVGGAHEHPLELLDQQPPHAAEGAASGAVGGGWFGYLGYDLGRGLEPVGASPPTAHRLPPFALAFYDHLLRLDANGRWWFEALWTAPRAAVLERRLELLLRRASAETPARRPFATDPWAAAPGGPGHELAVAACRRRIFAGDLFQANICVRLGSRLRGDPLDLFAAGASALRPDRAAFLAGPWGAVASFSPELFLERRARYVRSAPIKGTRRRGERSALEASGKDRAENVMIVDLVRNDLGRVCVPGSIAVDALAESRSHTGVWHLVSEVSGRLRESVRNSELVRAAFPPGSVTGAPKVAALNVIAELESTPRDVYTGAIGFASPLAGLELSVVIRTFEFDPRGRAWLGVGGGIVADSDPAAEAAECVTKARPLLDAIGARLAGEPATRRPDTPAPLRLGPKPIPRPDPAAGVFETMLVAGGRPVALERHLARLARSIRALYRSKLPAHLRDELLERSSDVDHGRLRVDFRPGSGVESELTELSARRLPVVLAPATVPGGIGPHKWIDRRLIDRLGEAVGCEPLLCDLDGFVLEAGRANVFGVDEHGRLLTPPTDGRVLPGVTRARVLELAPRLRIETVVRPLRLHELKAARELFATGALGGVEPAQLGDALLPAGPVTALLRRSLDAESVRAATETEQAAQRHSVLVEHD